MSMNENLEVRVNELTDVIKGLSNKPYITASDLNGVLNNFVQRVTETNEENFEKLSNDMSDSLFTVLENKYTDIKERLSIFENFVASVEKTIQNPKVESEITRILNDIEALHSKMNSQEIQTEGLIKSFDSMRNVSSTGQITKLCDEIVSISKSYDGIVEVLNNNFQEFLRRIEAIGSREEIQRLRYFLESIEGNQNVLVSAMNAVNDKQEEIKNLVRQSSSAQTTERFDQIQAAFNQLNKLIIDTTTKADLEIIADKIASVADLINEFQRKYNENNENDIRNVFQGQLNNILSKLESLKLDNSAGVNEDIIRLYTSIAEFKDGLYSAVNTQLNDVIASMDVQFDKISNSMVNATLDNNESINNLTGEIQKSQSIMTDGLNDKINEIKETVKRQGQENITTIVNSLTGELSSLMEGIKSLSNNDGIQNLINAIEGLKSGLDIDSLIIQIDQIKSALDFTPIKEQLELLNKDEAVNVINNKIDKIMELSNNSEILNKLEEQNASNNLDGLYETLNSIGNKIDFSAIEEKISSIKEFLNNNLNASFSNINEKLNMIENINEEFVSLKNLDYLLGEIKSLIEENFRIQDDKNSENKEVQNDIKEALKTIYGAVTDDYKTNEIKELLNFIKDKINLVSDTDKNDGYENLEENLQFLKNGINEILNKIEPAPDIKGVEDALNIINGNLTEIHEKINRPFDSSTIENALDVLNGNVDNAVSKVADSIQENSTNFLNILNTLNDNLNVLNNKLNETSFKNDENIEKVLTSITENINFINSKILSNNDELINKNIQSMFNQAEENLNSVASEINNLISGIDTGLKNTKDDLNGNLNIVNSDLQNKIEALNDTFELSSKDINERLNIIDDKISNSNYEDKAAEIKEQIELLSELVKTVAQNPVNDYINSLEESILSANTNNTDITKEFIKESQTGILDALNSLKNTISLAAANNKESFNENVIPLFDEFELRLNEKITSLETLIEETGQTENNKTAKFLSDEIQNINTDIKNSIINFIEKTNEEEKNLLSELIKNQINEIHLDTVNYLKQESEILTSFITEKNELQEKELVSKIAQIISSKENSEARINLIKSVTDNLTKILNNSLELKDEFASCDSKFIEIKDAIEDIGSKISDSSSKANSSLEFSISSINENIKSSAQDVKNGFDEKCRIIEDKINSISSDSEEIKIDMKEAFYQNNSDIRASVENALNNLNSNNKALLNLITSALNSSSDLRKNDIINKVEELINGKNESFDNSLTDIKDNLDSVKKDFSGNMEKIVEQLKEEIEDIKSSIVAEIKERGDSTEYTDNIVNAVEQKLQDKVSIIETLIDNSSSKFDEKTSEIINKISENYQNSFNEKTDFIISQLKSDYENKLTDIQKIIDSKVYEIVNRNNEIIKDELKLRADAALKDISKEFKDKISKIESIFVKNEDDNADETGNAYTLADVESDIAKIRLGIEKNNKLTNFKEFASRLVELKNINLENAKISRVIGADIMRFDGWLKNTTAKIDLLASKIEKSEKIKMEDLKSRLIQSEKNQAMPQKLEEAVMSIYKKYRVQETKIEDMINKVDALFQKQTDTFDVKEFIDLFYDNTKKQESLISRIDAIEDKMDYMQAKIDHIISSCIDE